MSRNIRVAIVCSLLSVFFSLIGFVANAASGNTLFFPIVSNQIVLEEYAQIEMPFNVLPGVEPLAEQGTTGAWYITVFRIDSGSANGAWIVRWAPGTQTTALRPLGSFQAVDPIVPGPISGARGSVACGRLDHKIYTFTWANGDTRRPALLVHRLNGDTC